MRIEAVNICKAFKTNIVLNGFSHIFNDGTVTAIMGPSGCGKSTLISILMGVIAPDSGEIVITGKFKRSAVFQENRLCENLTAAANIRLVTGKRFTNQQIDEQLAFVGLNDITRKPVRELSGGMKRRVALVRALMAEYDVLFLDEPFKGLDEQTKDNVMRYCKEKTSGKTVIMVTHDKSECEFMADETIYL
ncbi:MAG: ATP-binding cassette domain-containing protein [Oscillospiraceae bacterium]